MSARNFLKLCDDQFARGHFVCVGLDSELGKIPESAQVSDSKHPENYLGLCAESTIFEFNECIVDATKDLVNAYKPNLAFYLEYGTKGISALRRTIRYIKDVAACVPVILDAKFADIGKTNTGYAKFAFEYLGADAVTVNPYLGGEALQPFLDYKDKGIIVLCRTSNRGSREFQSAHSQPLYQTVARHVVTDWNVNGNCALVVGATAVEELAEVRKIVGDMPILIPDIGAQGGDLEATVKAGKDSRDQGMIINSSRGIIFASKSHDFAEAARRETLKLKNLINQYLN